MIVENENEFDVENPLRDYGWMAGDYDGLTCPACGKKYSGDKRCWRCKQCATEMKEQSVTPSKDEVSKPVVKKEKPIKIPPVRSSGGFNDL